MLKKIPSLLIVLSFLSLTGVAHAALGTTTTADPCLTSAGGSSTWVAPTGAAPSNNVAAPINVSGTDQVKPGKLTVGTLPCPAPINNIWTPTSKLTVNGITDTAGFSNWGATFLSGLVSVGSTYTVTGTAKAPKLYVKADPLVGTFSSTNLPQIAALFGGNVAVRGTLGVTQNDGSVLPSSGLTVSSGYNTIYVQGIPVCLQNGSNCPTGLGTSTTGTTTTTSSSWTASGTSLYNTNTGTVMLGTTSNIYPSTKLFVSGTARVGADVNYGTSPVLSVAPGTVNFDAPGVIGGRMSINGTTGEVTIPGNLKVGGSSVCRADGTNCPSAGGITLGSAVYINQCPGVAFGMLTTVASSYCDGTTFTTNTPAGHLVP
ncbi:MAG: hypothetical protein WCG55_02645 [bacterium]